MKKQIKTLEELRALDGKKITCSINSTYIDVFTFESIYLDSYGREQTCYRLDKFHIDHIIPSSHFMQQLKFSDEEALLAETEEVLYRWWNYKNLRVLPISENISKNASIDMELIKEYAIEHLL